MKMIEINPDEMMSRAKAIAIKNGVLLTDNAGKIVKARCMMNCDLDKCICEPNNPERGCISPKCMKEIIETGQCHCRMYRRKG